jgi:RHS repeat-associated protein
MTYNAAGKLTEIKKDGQPLATYRYNALGQRIEKRLATGEVTQFLYIGSQLTKEKHFDDSGEWQWTRLYVHIGIQPVAFVHLVPEQPAEVYYILTDYSHRPFIVANAAGAAIWASQADPFGVGAPNEDYDQDGINLTLNLRFPGQYFDAESGLHYNLNRYYDPTTGRYLESDPIGLKGGLNTYAYVGGNPVNFVDPEGLVFQLAIPFLIEFFTADAAITAACTIAGAVGSELILNEIQEDVIPDIPDSTPKDKKLSDGEIKKLGEGGVNPHDLKDNSRQDLFKDRKGNIIVKPKAGNGPGDPTGYNINDF